MNKKRRYKLTKDEIRKIESLAYFNGVGVDVIIDAITGSFDIGNLIRQYCDNRKNTTKELSTKE